MATQKFKMPVFDYSRVPHKPHRTLSDDTWEPPEHKYFGKKRPDGKMEKEPAYVYQEYPRHLYYKEADGTLTVAEVNSDAERDALGKGWKTSPADFGLLTAPSFEQLVEMGQPTTLAQKITAEDQAAAEALEKADAKASRAKAKADAEAAAETDPPSADDEPTEATPAAPAKRRRLPKSRKGK